MTKRTRYALGLVTMLLMTGGAAYAQKPTSSTTSQGVSTATTSTKTTGQITPAPATPDLTTLNTAKILQQLTPAETPSDGQDVSPLQVVAEFLQLAPPQVNALEQLLQARQTALVPLFQAAQQLTEQLGVALSNGANPGAVGALVIQIHGLQQQMGEVQQAFVTQFVALLDPNQQQQLQAVQIAVQVNPVLPAFKLIFLY